MPLIQLLVESPEGMSLASLREVLAMNGVTVCECHASASGRTLPTCFPRKSTPPSV